MSEDKEQTMLEQYKEMSGANQFLAEHCGKTMKEQLMLLQGVSHSVNRCNAEYAALFDRVESLGEENAALKTKLSAAMAAIGKLQEQVVSLEKQVKLHEESLDKAREAYAKLRKNGGNQGK